MQVVELWMKNAAEIYNHALYLTDWNFNLKAPESPTQINTYDCGVFLMTTAKYICNGLTFDFEQNDMTFICQAICNELLNYVAPTGINFFLFLIFKQKKLERIEGIKKWKRNERKKKRYFE